MVCPTCAVEETEREGRIGEVVVRWLECPWCKEKTPRE